MGLEAILKRKKEIRALLEDTEQRNLDLDALEKELGELEQEEAEIRRRMEILEKVPQATKEVEKPHAQEQREAVVIYDRVEYRQVRRGFHRHYHHERRGRWQVPYRQPHRSYAVKS